MSAQQPRHGLLGRAPAGSRVAVGLVGERPDDLGRLDRVPARRSVVGHDRRDPATGAELVHERVPLRWARCDDQHRQQVVQFVGRGRCRLDLGPDTVDRLLGDPAHLFERRGRQSAPQRHGGGAPVDGLAVVEERIGPGGEDLVRQKRRLGRVDEVEPHVAVAHPPPQVCEAVGVERLGQGIVHGLARQRVVGHLDRPGDVLLALAVSTRSKIRICFLGRTVCDNYAGIPA